MQILYSFLQKRKLHESQYGFIMVFAAYIISAFMLALGSDSLYNINSKAAGVSTEIEEKKLQESISVFEMETKIPYLQTLDYKVRSLDTKLINPYGLTENNQGEQTEKVLSETESRTSEGNTVWLLGNAMNSETFDKVMEQYSNSMESKTKITQEKQLPKASKREVTEETVNSKYAGITREEVRMLERIVEAEASGEDLQGKILVANVILNRVKSGTFPDNIKGVIFQKSKGTYQFSPIADERYWSVKISASTEKAVEKALDGVDYSDGALYFIARKRTNTHSAAWFDNHLRRLFKHGGHEFYKNR
jgi:Cell wall hydrolyses involved in spore germination